MPVISTHLPYIFNNILLLFACFEHPTHISKIADVIRRADLAEWAAILGKVHKRKIQIYAYANNHFAGHGPATVEMFQELWRRQVKEQTNRGTPATLFPM
jgi:hypothetical protein